MGCGFYEMSLAHPFEKLPFWFSGGDGGGGGGLGHIFFMTWHTDWETTAFPTGRAIHMRSAATNRTYLRVRAHLNIFCYRFGSSADDILRPCLKECTSGALG